MGVRERERRGGSEKSGGEGEREAGGVRKKWG